MIGLWLDYFNTGTLLSRFPAGRSHFWAQRWCGQKGCAMLVFHHLYQFCIEASFGLISACRFWKCKQPSVSTTALNDGLYLVIRGLLSIVILYGKNPETWGYNVTEFQHSKYDLFWQIEKKVQNKIINSHFVLKIAWKSADLCLHWRRPSLWVWAGWPGRCWSCQLWESCIAPQRLRVDTPASLYLFATP